MMPRKLPVKCGDEQTAAALMLATETVLRSENAHMHEQYDQSVMDMATKQHELNQAAARRQYELDNPDLSNLIEDMLEPVQHRLSMQLGTEGDAAEPRQPDNPWAGQGPEPPF